MTSWLWHSGLLPVFLVDLRLSESMGHGGPAAAGNRTRVSKERIPRVLPLDHCDDEIDDEFS